MEYHYLFLSINENRIHTPHPQKQQCGLGKTSQFGRNSFCVKSKACNFGFSSSDLCSWLAHNVGTVNHHFQTEHKEIYIDLQKISSAVLGVALYLDLGRVYEILIKNFTLELKYSLNLVWSNHIVRSTGCVLFFQTWPSSSSFFSSASSSSSSSTWPSLPILKQRQLMFCSWRQGTVAWTGIQGYKSARILNRPSNAIKSSFSQLLLSLCQCFCLCLVLLSLSFLLHLEEGQKFNRS